LLSGVANASLLQWRNDSDGWPAGDSTYGPSGRLTGTAGSADALDDADEPPLAGAAPDARAEGEPADADALAEGDPEADDDTHAADAAALHALALPAKYHPAADAEGQPRTTLLAAQ